MDLSTLKNNLKLLNQEISSKVACFTGHRPQKLKISFEDNYEHIRDLTKSIIEKSILEGYEVFICGMSIGFDMLCAEIVLELKERYSHIKLVGALPCKNQSNKWTKLDKIKYNNILNKLDKIRCINDFYVKGCMQERNMYMVNNASLVIAFFQGADGGTKQTIDYAKKQGKKIVYIKV